jgi:hypothetical protein
MDSGTAAAVHVQPQEHELRTTEQPSERPRSRETWKVFAHQASEVMREE